ncbi:ATP-dependent zinc protease family protein [Fodinibius saliphilus]|uniref:ATP-dependent zinc protease family protein n=1 Tax=Fodinibius saliphilus TaxID=1920650 RepID=UPI0011086448|nr:ATP-dependent zinc protease [Fodinibius saliphilus]
MASQFDNLKIIGRLERVDFPEWNIFDINAKIDTGAYTSSLHCHHIEPYERDGESYVRFNLLDPSHDTYKNKTFELPIYRTKMVKSSNGSTEERYVVKSAIQLFGEKLTAEFSLTDRSEMRYPVLLGRKLLNGRFLVDVSQKYISQKIEEKKI